MPRERFAVSHETADNEGELTDDERSEQDQIRSAFHLVTIPKAKSLAPHTETHGLKGQKGPSTGLASRSKLLRELPVRPESTLSRYNVPSAASRRSSLPPAAVSASGLSA